MYNSYSNPISFSDQTFSSSKLLPHDSNLPNSKHEIDSHHPRPPLPPLQPSPAPPLSFFHFPSPFHDDEIFYQQRHNHEFFLPHQALAEVVVNMEVVSNKIAPCKGQRATTASEQIPRRRSCKRDRHSKIKTARGFRDRRMRLSLEVAKRFFGLQDMLGFEKASKTVEWLLNQAKDEIKQMVREKKNQLLVGCDHGVKSASSTSECEGVSGLDEVAVSGNRKLKRENPSKSTKSKVSRKSAFFHPFAKESREKARERARERTKEKMRNRISLADESKQCNEATNQYSRLGSYWNPFEMAEDSGAQSQNMNYPPLDALSTEVEEQSSQAKDRLGIIDDMASIFFDSVNNSGLILQEHQFAELQSLGKPWEAYNNHI